MLADGCVKFLAKGGYIIRKGGWYQLAYNDTFSVISEVVVNQLVERGVVRAEYGRLVYNPDCEPTCDPAVYELAHELVARVESTFCYGRCVGTAIWRDRSGKLLHSSDEVWRAMETGDLFWPEVVTQPEIPMRKAA